MYVIIDTEHSATLVEMTAAEFREAEAAQGKTGRLVTRWSADRACKWVKDGGHHGTPLYIDHDGRVRYARDGY